MRGPLALLVLAILAYLAVGPFLDYLSDLMWRPWARAQPSVLDGWRGQLTTGNGQRLMVSLHLERARTSDGRAPCARCNHVQGTATTCDARGTVRAYEISGSPTDRRASSLRLGAVPASDPRPDGLELDVLVGRWDGADALELNADFHWRRGQSAISSTDDPATQPVPIQLTRDALAMTRPCGP
jgi:hypothetical protein